MRELLEDELQNPLDPSAEEAAHDEELFDFAFGHNHMLLMAYLVLLLSAAKPYFKQGRTYSFGPEVYLFARIERACSKWPQSACKTRGARRPIEKKKKKNKAMTEARRSERAKCAAKVKERSGTRRRQARTPAADGGRQR